MHELGIVFEIQKRVAAVAEENGLSLRDIAQVVVEVGDRGPGDQVEYPREDLRLVVGADGKRRALHKDGTPY